MAYVSSSPWLNTLWRRDLCLESVGGNNVCQVGAHSVQVVCKLVTDVVDIDHFNAFAGYWKHCLFNIPVLGDYLSVGLWWECSCAEFEYCTFLDHFLHTLNQSACNTLVWCHMKHKDWWSMHTSIVGRCCTFISCLKSIELSKWVLNDFHGHLGSDLSMYLLWMECVFGC